ncbi:MAG: NlpC/P60 family protein [Elusimicrobia bacterium]|nr:NlpC/P60 family protein [Elusimicrobiota bacterium]
MRTRRRKHSACPRLRSWTLPHMLPGDFKGAFLRNLVPASYPAGAFAVKDPGRGAALTSPELPALFPFDQLLLSASVVFPSGGAFSAEARVKTGRGWSPWFSFGTFEPGRSASAAPLENQFGRMDTDILKLKGKASAFRYRLTIRASGKKAPLLRLVTVCYTDSALPFRPGRRPEKPALRLRVPRLSQMALKAEHSKDICSPVSVSMALAGLGLKAAPLETAFAARDYRAKIFGNWFFSTAYAGSRGALSLLARLNSLEEARSFLEAGVPVIASVTFGPGELRGAPIKKTAGHLLVMTGFTASGDVVVNDPAAPSVSSVERVYPRAQFERAWLGNKYGLAYIAAGGLSAFMRVKARFAELYSAPPAAAADRKKLIESQLVFNERAELLEVSGRWARIRALEQHSLRADGRTLLPYEGWVELAALAPGLPQVPNAVVRIKTSKCGPSEFSLGVKVYSCGDGSPALPAGRLSAAALNPLPGRFPPARLRLEVPRTARLFLGDRYYWGGRSAWGVDCSGLVGIAFRAWGLELPRNAGDQYFASRRVQPSSLLPGDLIFSADASEPADITHVMIYTGRGRLLEATGDSNSVREIPFERKFGVPFSSAANGMMAGGKKVFFRRVIP